MTQQEFFDWAETQDAPYEFDGFQPVAMTGGTPGHSSVIRNINVQFKSRLRGKPCEPLGPDAGVATEDDTLHLPEVGIEIPVAAIYEGIALNEKRAPDA